MTFQLPIAIVCYFVGQIWMTNHRQTVFIPWFLAFAYSETSCQRPQKHCSTVLAYGNAFQTDVTNPGSAGNRAVKREVMLLPCHDLPVCAINTHTHTHTHTQQSVWAWSRPYRSRTCRWHSVHAAETHVFVVVEYVKTFAVNCIHNDFSKVRSWWL